MVREPKNGDSVIIRVVTMCGHLGFERNDVVEKKRMNQLDSIACVFVVNAFSVLDGNAAICTRLPSAYVYMDEYLCT